MRRALLEGLGVLLLLPAAASSPSATRPNPADGTADSLPVCRYVCLPACLPACLPLSALCTCLPVCLTLLYISVC